MAGSSWPRAWPLPLQFTPTPAWLMGVRVVEKMFSGSVESYPSRGVEPGSAWQGRRSPPALVPHPRRAWPWQPWRVRLAVGDAKRRLARKGKAHPVRMLALLSRLVASRFARHPSAHAFPPGVSETAAPSPDAQPLGRGTPLQARHVWPPQGVGLKNRFSDRSLGPLQGTLAQSAQRSLAHRPATPGIALVRAFGFTAHPFARKARLLSPAGARYFRQHYGRTGFHPTLKNMFSGLKPDRRSDNTGLAKRRAR